MTAVRMLSALTLQSSLAVFVMKASLEMEEPVQV